MEWKTYHVACGIYETAREQADARRRQEEEAAETCEAQIAARARDGNDRRARERLEREVGWLVMIRRRVWWRK